MSIPTRKIFGERSCTIRTAEVEAAVTERGGHLAPVAFHLGARSIQPFSIAPWWNESLGDIPVILQVLRGDFFCLPFAGGTLGKGREVYTTHGETAGGRWNALAREKTKAFTRLHLQMDLTIRKGRVDKWVELRSGHHAVYQRHIISGMSGSMPVGHHATLKFESEGLISTSSMRFGQVCPYPFEDPVKGGYNALKMGAEFDRLDAVPMAGGGMADLSRYPAREGFEDLVMISQDPQDEFAWTAAAFPRQRYVWIAFKDPRKLASTVLWHSNGGRHYKPWNGRHRSVLGIEDVTSHFAQGIDGSTKKNGVNARGIPTALSFSPGKPATISYIMAVAEIPAGFDHVEEVTRTAIDTIVIRSRNGRKARATVDLDYLQEE
jgi:hypothetical protein